MSSDSQTSTPAANAQGSTQAVAIDDFARIIGREVFRFTTQERSVILETCCGGATQAEADQLVRIAEARGLNPLTGDCYFVKRWDNAKGREVWAVQTSIDAMRAKAEESGDYAGQDEPEFEYTEDKKLILARIRVWRVGVPRPFIGVARWREFVQLKKDGQPTSFWAKMPHNQLAKCAEAQAIRRAFPRRFAQVMTADEGHEPGEREMPDDAVPSQGVGAAAALKAPLDEKLAERAAKSAAKAGPAPAAQATAQAPPEAKPEPVAGPPCLVCGKPTGPDAIATHGAAGEVGLRHPDCSPFVGREPGED